MLGILRRIIKEGPAAKWVFLALCLLGWLYVELGDWRVAFWVDSGWVEPGQLDGWMTWGSFGLMLYGTYVFWGLFYKLVLHCSGASVGFWAAARFGLLLVVIFSVFAWLMGFFGVTGVDLPYLFICMHQAIAFPHMLLPAVACGIVLGLLLLHAWLASGVFGVSFWRFLLMDLLGMLLLHGLFWVVIFFYAVWAPSFKFV